MGRLVRYTGTSDTRVIEGVEWSENNDWTVPEEDLPKGLIELLEQQDDLDILDGE